MNTQDTIKFLDVFCDVIEYGKLVKCTPENYEIYLSKIPEHYLDSFERYLTLKADSEELEDPDAWDNWYDNLSIDKIPEDELKFRDLPTKKLEISMSNGELFVREIYGYAKAFIEYCKPIVKPDDNVHISYSFTPEGIFMYYYSMADKTGKNKKGKEVPFNKETTKKVYDYYNKILRKQLDSARDNYNNVQGESNLHLDYFAMKGQDACYGSYPNSASSFSVTPEDLYYIDGNTVTKNDIQSIFNVIKDEITI